VFVVLLRTTLCYGNLINLSIPSLMDGSPTSCTYDVGNSIANIYILRQLKLHITQQVP